MAGPESPTLGTISVTMNDLAPINLQRYQVTVGILESKYASLFYESAALLTSLQYDFPGKSINVPTLSQLVAVSCMNEFMKAETTLTERDFILVELQGGTTCLLFNTDSGVHYLYGLYNGQSENDTVVEIKSGTLQQLHLDLSDEENEINYKIRSIENSEREHIFGISDRLIAGYFPKSQMT